MLSSGCCHFSHGHSASAGFPRATPPQGFCHLRVTFPVLGTNTDPGVGRGSRGRRGQLTSAGDFCPRQAQGLPLTRVPVWAPGWAPGRAGTPVDAGFPSRGTELRSASWKPVILGSGGKPSPHGCQLLDESPHTLFSVRELPPLVECEFPDLHIPPLCPRPAEAPTLLTALSKHVT